MGPCHADSSNYHWNSYIVPCIIQHSAWSPVWIDPSLHLPSLGADADTVTLSGFSGGSYFTAQQAVINSDVIKGAGMFNGGPYGTSVIDRGNAQNDLLTFAQKSITMAEKEQSAGNIDPLNNLKNMPIYIHSGIIDGVVYPRLQRDQRTFFDHFGSKIKYVPTQHAHTVPRITKGCKAQSDNELINPTNCGYDGAGDMLTHLLTNLKEGAISELNPMDNDWQSKGVLRRYSQQALISSSIFDHDGYEPFGFIYYPFQCIDGSKKCKIHIHQHGCNAQTRGFLGGWGTMYKLGFTAYAASNDLIMIFPQTAYSYGNPFGCPDSFGVTGYDYLQKGGLQSTYIRDVIKRVTQPYDPVKYDYQSGNLLTRDFFGDFAAGLYIVFLDLPYWIFVALPASSSYQILYLLGTELEIPFIDAAALNSIFYWLPIAP